MVRIYDKNTQHLHEWNNHTRSVFSNEFIYTAHLDDYCTTRSETEPIFVLHNESSVLEQVKIEYVEIYTRPGKTLMKGDRIANVRPETLIFVMKDINEGQQNKVTINKELQYKLRTGDTIKYYLTTCITKDKKSWEVYIETLDIGEQCIKEDIYTNDLSEKEAFVETDPNKVRLLAIYLFAEAKTQYPIYNEPNDVFFNQWD